MRKTIGILPWIALVLAIGGCGFKTPASPPVQDSKAFRALALDAAEVDGALTEDPTPAAARTDVSVAVFLAGQPRKSRLVIGIVDRGTLRFAVRTFDPTPGSVILRVVTFDAVPAPESGHLQAFAAALDASGKVISYDSTPVSAEPSSRVDAAFASTQLSLGDETAGPD